MTQGVSIATPGIEHRGRVGLVSEHLQRDLKGRREVVPMTALIVCATKNRQCLGLCNALLSLKDSTNDDAVAVPQLRSALARYTQLTITVVCT